MSKQIPPTPDRFKRFKVASPNSFHETFDLFPAESRLLQYLVNNEQQDLVLGNTPDPLNENQLIHADYFIWLIRFIHDLYDKNTVVISGAVFIGVVDFKRITINIGIKFDNCIFDSVFDVYDCDFKDLCIKNCELVSFVSVYSKYKGNVRFENTSASSGITLAGSVIQGQLILDKVNIHTRGIFAESLNVTEVFSIQNESSITGILYLYNAKLNSLIIGGGSTLDADEGIAIVGDNISINNKLSIVNATIKGEIHLIGADIRKSLDINSVNLHKASNGRSISLDKSVIRGDINIGKPPTEDANFRTIIGGLISITGANVQGSITIHSVISYNDGLPVILTSHAKVFGNFVLANSIFHGAVDCSNTTYFQSIEINNCSIFNPSGTALHLERITVNESLQFIGNNNIKGILNLIFGKVNIFKFPMSSWTDRGNLILDNFEYLNLDLINTKPSEWRMLLSYQNLTIPASSQPYYKLAHILKINGQQEEAKNVLIDRMRNKRRDMNLAGKAWDNFVDITSAYGYRTRNTILSIILYILIGSFIFNEAGRNNLMVPTDITVASSFQYLTKNKLPIGYINYDPLIYAIDRFIPFIDLHQKKNWQPDNSILLGKILYYITTFYVVFGWVLMSVAISYLTGFIKKED